MPASVSLLKAPCPAMISLLRLELAKLRFQCLFAGANACRLGGAKIGCEALDRCGQWTVADQRRHAEQSFTIASYNNIVLMMIPKFISVPGAPWPVLPAGIHSATLAEIDHCLAYNPCRRRLFGGLLAASANLVVAGCQALFLDGSFITEKPYPVDFDACWVPNGVDRQLLDPVFSQFSNKRSAQRMKFGGEIFPSTTSADAQGRNFVDFFQVEKFTGQPKGILFIDLSRDPMLPKR